VDAAQEKELQAVVVEPWRQITDDEDNGDTLLGEMVPVLSKRATAEADDMQWARRAIEVGRVLGRWFRILDEPLSR
jgi:hypothetical protein